MNLPPLPIQDYWYDLPAGNIALFPLPHRESARLLCYQQGKISHRLFAQLPDLLPDNAVLFFNDTRVIPARFFFEKATGASIEVFLIQPFPSLGLVSSTLAATGHSTWKCTIGNSKRWSKNLVLKKVVGEMVLCAQLVDKANGIVELSWTPPHLAFAEVLQAAGAVPLPPYIKREAEVSDRERYQTVYARFEGAVAAPTAGLHFSPSVFEQFKSRRIVTDFLTLHVGAGTFLPVKAANAVEHSMHAEQVIIRRESIQNLLLNGKKIVAVGTTVLRTLESLYWYGVKLLTEPAAPFIVEKLQPYQERLPLPSTRDALEAVLSSMDRRGITDLVGQTSIYIFPGYRFKVCQGLITNFHQPGSTLLLLIAAFIGPDWKKIYREALENDYRFLSYGDSSLLVP